MRFQDQSIGRVLAVVLSSHFLSGRARDQPFKEEIEMHERIEKKKKKEKEVYRSCQDFYLLWSPVWKVIIGGP